MQYRSYRASDQERIVKIFESNCPKYFDPNDKDDLIDFLKNWTNEDYLVVIINGNIIGCGGHYVKEDRFGIAWVIFCLLYTSPSPRDTERSRMPSSA